MSDLIAGALFGLLIGIGCLPGLLHSAKVYCDEGYKVCVGKKMIQNKNHDGGP